MQNPNLEWYAAKSREMDGPIRCPFARANLCPRYYESLYLLGSVGMTTKIPEETKLKLDSQWKNFEATIGEEAASISGGDSNLTKAMSNFCPEVSYKIFGLFASGLYPHHGEIDRANAYTRLTLEKAARDDPRWNWANLTALHYSECSEYSILQNEGTRMRFGEREKQTAVTTVYNIGTVQGAAGNVNDSNVTVNDSKSISTEKPSQSEGP